MRTMRPARRRSALATVLAVGALAGVAALAASASAAAPIALDAPGNGSPPLVAYDPSTQTTYVAWSDPHLPGVDLCVVPAGATGCMGGAPVLLEDSKYPGYSSLNTPGLGGLVVLPDGKVVVIGTPASTGSVAWASPAGGFAFLSGEHGLQNGGQFISPVSLFYTFGNAVALSDTEVGLLDDSHHFVSNFSDSPLTAESPAISGSGNSNPGEQYPGKAQFTNGPEIAAEPAPAPAPAGSEIVVGVGANESAAELTPPGCLNYAASGYGVSAGLLDGTSKSPGTLNEKGLPAYTLLACSADAPVLAQGGKDGIGVLEQEGSGISGAGSNYQLGYRPFVATATGGTFGAPVELSDVTSEVLNGVNELDLSEDSGTGVYALWEDKQGTVMDYSGNGGATWEGPTVAPPPYGGHDVIVGTGAGNAEIAYESNPGTGTQVFLQPVNYAALVAANSSPTPIPTPIPPPPPPPPLPAPTSALTIPKQTDDVTSKGGLSVVVDCTGARCSGSLTLIVKVKQTTGKGKKKKTKIVAETIGTVSFSSLALGTDTVAMKLNGKGLSLLKYDGYKLSSTGSATYLSGSIFKTATGSVTLKGHKPKKKKK